MTAPSSKWFRDMLDGDPIFTDEEVLQQEKEAHDRYAALKAKEAEEAADRMEDANRRKLEADEESRRIDLEQDLKMFTRFGERPPKGKRKPVVRRLLRRGQICVLWGPPGCYKSFVAIDLCIRVALGKDLWGSYKTIQGDVLYLNGEGQEGFPDRISAWCKGFDGDKAPLAKHAVMSSRIPDLRKPDTLTKIDTLCETWDINPDVIVVDTMAQMLREDQNENDASVMTQVMRTCRQMADRYDALILILHHAKKDGSEPRGSSAILGAADMMIRTSGSHIAGQRIVSLANTKAKDVEGIDSTMLTIESVDLGMDEHGDRITSLRIKDLLKDDENAEKWSGLDPIETHYMRLIAKCQDMNQELSAAYLRDKMVEDLGIPKTQDFDIRYSLTGKRLLEIDGKKITVTNQGTELIRANHKRPNT